MTMVKGNQHQTWASLFDDEQIGTSSGEEKIPRRNYNGYGPYADDEENLDPETQQIREILHLHAADHPGMQLVASHLTGTNFLNWSRSIKRALGAKSKLELLDGTLREPESTSKYYKQWIMNSISKELVNSFSHYDTTKKLWDALCRRFDRSNGPKISKLEKEIRSYSQGNQNVMDYFNNLTVLWNEMDMVLPLVECVCDARAILDKREEDRRLVQFLLGLNDEFEHARSQILMMDPLPTVDKAYSMVTQVEDEKSVHESITEERGQMVMYMHKQGGHNAGYSSNQYRGYQNEKRLSKDEKKKLRCNHCKENGHEMHECFKLHGYPSELCGGKPFRREYYVKEWGNI